ncbi:MAG: NAD-dependent epimerase/dehydratase family protein [Gammaproteobacteria bacterium]
MKPVLLIGGSGFAGRALADRLLRAGYEVHVLARSRPDRTAHQGLHWHTGSVGDREPLEMAVAECETVVHLASQTTPGSSARSPHLEATLNIGPTLQLLETLESHPEKRLLYVSSGGAVYGNPERERVSEDEPTRPISYYGAGKLAIEGFLRAFQWRMRTSVTILRASNFYGPGQPRKKGFGVIRTVFDCVLAGDTFEIWGDGESIRDYLYIEDFVDACMRIIEHSTNDPRLAIYNVGTGEGYSINQICALIESTADRKLERRYRASRSTDVRRIVLDCSLLRDDFGWKTKTDLPTGLKQTWEWLKTQ